MGVIIFFWEGRNKPWGLLGQSCGNCLSVCEDKCCSQNLKNTHCESMDPSIIVTNKPVHFVVLTDSFIIFSVKLLKPHKTAKCTLTGLKA